MTPFCSASMASVVASQMLSRSDWGPGAFGPSTGRGHSFAASARILAREIVISFRLACNACVCAASMSLSFSASARIVSGIATICLQFLPDGDGIRSHRVGGFGTSDKGGLRFLAFGLKASAIGGVDGDLK